MDAKLRAWFDEMEQPENEHEFCLWAHGRGMMDRQIQDQNVRAGFDRRGPVPSLQGYKFKGKVKKAYYSGYWLGNRQTR